jgi:hypothetical protein
MTFKKEFLIELQKILNGSNLYRMTKSSVEILLKSKLLYEDDKCFIFSSLINDISKNKDPLSLAVFWNKNINDPKLEFIF